MNTQEKQSPIIRLIRARTIGNIPLTAILLAMTIIAWMIMLDHFRNMASGPGMSLGTFSWYVGMWVTMTAAMMLPSVTPMVITFARVSAERTRNLQIPLVSTWIFLLGYLIAWTTYGLIAYGLYSIISLLNLDFLAWDQQGPIFAGLTVALGGLYQLTPLKQACLRHCRNPLHYVLNGWRGGRLGAIRMGVEHGFHCVGCCWGLMIILFAVGIMNLFWMGVITLLTFLEKVLPTGEYFSKVIGIGLIFLGIWIAIDPSSVPFFVEPYTKSHISSHGTHI
ncbi:hypothetical protein bcere0016_54000 [Bacillus cereus 95/8201]|uniref:DUF2182 domain-containing protein n=2 Tax=Bacillus cereus group TaxID=86661 RepID=UPI0001A08CCE|nr:DUF2182 domain-containing protein [Bacillus cereus]AJH60405.1 hypothetical protein BG11_5552 [Bacillus cereus]AJK37354.1 hypothetical protein BF33_5713 [Bacillus cereus]EEL14005.1 hypothetical protein bcere0016_54000 [Bacillus cereus 95/8201]QKH69355.1 DUF2182 domain-containing protein [Bacillus cereus]QKH71452.1 DUF2182 domain-containing protein [Bacillus cereus]